MDLSYLSHSPAAAQWQKISLKHHHGIAIPLFSLHTSQSMGIGEFTDLFSLIDWCSIAGLDIIQLLPLNDTGGETSPYSSHSAFSLNPLCLGLNALPHLEDFPFLLESLKRIPKFSSSSRVNYTLVRKHKMKFLSDYYESVGPEILKSDSFLRFAEEAAWLKSYAVFKVLKDQFNQANWEEWPEKARHPSASFIDCVAKRESKNFHFYCILQFLCDKQMREVKDYAQKKNIFLMGDVPILVDRDSSDVWANREFFDLNYSAGAPPDSFSADGQNWGFPIYNWNTLKETNYCWWRDRLKWIARYYQIYRIDHIVGFFRIWAFPLNLPNEKASYIPSDESFWIDQGQKLMIMMLESIDMLPIGEDLGVVPTEIRNCLTALGICGTKVMRWERKWNEDKQFIPAKDYPLLSMTTVATHDSETLGQWWQLFPDEAKMYAHLKGWTYEPFLSLQQRYEILWESHHSGSLFHINPLQEFLALVPLLNGPSEENQRINIPGTVSDLNWTYRIKPSIEELLSNQTLIHIVKELIE